MKISIKRSELLKSKGQVELPPIPPVELTPGGKETLDAILADILKLKYEGETDERT